MTEDDPLTVMTLADLGWSAHFQDQLTPEDAPFSPARISAVHRDRVDALMPDGPVSLTLPTGLMTSAVAVGDWVLTDGAVLHRLLDRQSILTRRAAGKGIERQLIAANLDRLAIITSCNAEFNVARLDRYIALAHAGGVAPAIILTKADITDPAPYIADAERAARGAPVLALDTRDPAAAERLAQWCGPGQTLGLVGSSGVGKSTLAGSLTGILQETGPIREADSRGRHTTSARFLIRTLFGGWLIDTPGMRELRLAEAAEGIAATFDDLDALSHTCRFTDCAHESEPGCAIRAALEDGTLDPDRLLRWRKLIAEDRHNNETVHEARARSRSFGKMVKAVTSAKTRKR
jgi:ribosome biogenesis GTPase / thiamine phosphate phosphatase